MTKETGIYNEAKTTSSIMVLGKLDSFMLKNVIITYFSILAGKIPWTEEPDRLSSVG